MNSPAPSSVIALFKDNSDRSDLLPLLHDVPGLVCLESLPCRRDLPEAMQSRCLSPRLLILSSRLYPESRPELVAELRSIYADTPILLVSRANDPIPALQRLAADNLRHLVVTPAEGTAEENSPLRIAITRLLSRTAWNLPDYVSPGSTVYEFPLTHSQQKESIIAYLEDVIADDTPEMELLRQRAALLADEMIENALYGAPQDSDGCKLFLKGRDRAIGSQEGISFRFAFDGETLALEITDGWGTLAPELVLDFLARNQSEAARDGMESGGRGLFIIWRFMDHMHVHVRPGMQTVLGGHLRAVATVDPEGPKGFSISAEYHIAEEHVI